MREDWIKGSGNKYKKKNILMITIHNIINLIEIRIKLWNENENYKIYIF